MGNFKRVKVVVFCPSTNADAVREAMRKAGAGIIIDYDVSQLVNSVLKLLTNERLLIQYQKNALGI